ncbi:hypothetical protein RDMS_04875 [Deinococcus sp. RL]|nr:hypothetical protein RDMS_04875 [Deinococcus sp. RL]
MPPEVQQAVERYRLNPDVLEILHHAKSGLWHVRSGERLLRWALADSSSAPHILRDAGMLAVLERHQLAAPQLLALDQNEAFVVSVQTLLMPTALCDVTEVGLEEAGWRSLGAYIRAYQDRLQLPDFSPEHPEQAWEEKLRSLERRGEVGPQDVRWLRHWRSLLPGEGKRVLTHGYVDPAWIVAHPSRQLVLGLTEWSIAEHREPGHDLLRIPAEALPHVLEGYGPGAAPRLLRAKLSELVQEARTTSQEVPLADQFDRFRAFLEPYRPTTRSALAQSL